MALLRSFGQIYKGKSLFEMEKLVSAADLQNAVKYFSKDGEGAFIGYEVFRASKKLAKSCTNFGELHSGVMSLNNRVTKLESGKKAPTFMEMVSAASTREGEWCDNVTPCPRPDDNCFQNRCLRPCANTEQCRQYAHHLTCVSGWCVPPPGAPKPVRPHSAKSSDSGSGDEDAGFV